MTAKPATEEQMIHLVRNALLVAGQEMGDGDQWPVVKDTIYKIMQDWENLKTERNVDEELRKHIGVDLQEIRAGLDKASPEVRAALEPKFREMCEALEAHFAPVNQTAIFHDEENEPQHVKRMKTILKSMEDNDAE